MKFIKNLFKKKFEIRINHWYSNLYTIDWCYYRLFKIPHSLCDYCTLFREWKVRYLWYDKAVKIANNIKSIDDVKKYYQPFEVIEFNCLEKERKINESIIPTTIIHRSNNG